MTASWKIEVLELDVYCLLYTFRVPIWYFGVPCGFLGSFQEIGVADKPGSLERERFLYFSKFMHGS